MSSSIKVSNPEIINNHVINTFSKWEVNPNIAARRNANFEIFASEGCENFATYIDWLGLSKGSDLVVLSSMHHYYYDAEELKNVRSVVNLKEFNYIRNLNSFIHSIYNLAPEKCYFIGCFINNKKRNGYVLRSKSSHNKSEMISDAVENGIVSRNPFLNMIYSLLDYRTNRYLSKNEVKMLLEDRGFNILDMTEYQGTTYFCAQKVGSDK